MTEIPRPSRLDVIQVPDQQERVIRASESIAKAAHKKVLFLSGGNTPALVYERLAGLVREKKFLPLAAALVDERLDRSNQHMIETTGLPDALNLKGVKFYHLRPNISDGDVLANLYEGDMRLLLGIHGKAGMVGIFGAGADGHTGGIAPNHDSFVNPLFGPDYTNRLVGYCNDSLRDFRRVTLTPEAIRKLIRRVFVLVEGESKREVLNKLSSSQTQLVEEFPAALLNEPGKRTTVYTDLAA